MWGKSFNLVFKTGFLAKHIENKCVSVVLFSSKKTDTKFELLLNYVESNVCKYVAKSNERVIADALKCKKE
jgi:hypothetical protein